MPNLNKDSQNIQVRNLKQKAYYEDLSWSNQSSSHSIATNAWRRLRNRVMNVVSPSKRQKLYEIHKEWMGDLKNSKVLDLGVGTGSRLTNYIAKNSKEYHALDLSYAQIQLLREKLIQHEKCDFHVMDFLSEEFSEREFDVIYAHSVFHHFDHLDLLSQRCLEVLKPSGIIVTYDPIITWFPIRMLRTLYRPFQSDSDWEHPFTSQSISALQRHFELDGEVGLFRKAKWALLVGIVSTRLGRKLGDAWFEDDLKNAGAILLRPAPLTVSLCLSPRRNHVE